MGMKLLDTLSSTLGLRTASSGPAGTWRGRIGVLLSGTGLECRRLRRLGDARIELEASANGTFFAVVSMLGGREIVSGRWQQSSQSVVFSGFRLLPTARFQIQKDGKRLALTHRGEHGETLTVLLSRIA